MALSEIQPVELQTERTRGRLAYWSLAAAFVLTMSLFFIPIPEDNKGLVNTLVPVVVTALLGFNAYYYSASSKDKKGPDNSTNTVNVADKIDTKIPDSQDK